MFETKYFEIFIIVVTNYFILMKYNFYEYLRALVRVGEHDRLSTTDGEHEDIPIVHVEKHPAYNISGDAKNDIMILFLNHDVQITGRTLSTRFFQLEWSPFAMNAL